MTADEDLMKQAAQRSDRQLLDEARRGEAGAFATIYRRHAPWPLGLARGWTQSEDDANDLVQESFLWLLRSLPNLKLRRQLPAYLSKAVWHFYMKSLRTETRRAKRERLYATKTGSWESTLAELAIHDLLESLALPHREILVLHYLEGRTIAEIAELLGRPEGTVQSRLNKALRDLREKN